MVETRDVGRGTRLSETLDMGRGTWGARMVETRDVGREVDRKPLCCGVNLNIYDISGENESLPFLTSYLP